MVGEFEFDTSKVDKSKNPRKGGYMITSDNVETKHAYKKAKELRIKEEKQIVHRVLHPLFHKTEEELREHDTKMAKEAEEQKRKSREMSGWNTTTAETGGNNEDDSDESEEVVVVYGAAKKRRFKLFTKENTGNKIRRME